MSVSGKAIGLFVLAMLVATVGPAAQAQGDDPVFKAAVGHLQKAVQRQTDQSHAARMRGLRMLDDPSLAPLMERLAGSRDPVFQVFGVVGLAQLSEAGTIDLAQLAEIDGASYVSTAVSAALDDELISTPQLKTVAAWKDIDNLVKLLVQIELQSQGEPIDTAWLKPLIEIDPACAELTPRERLEYIYAASLLVQRNDPAGVSALNKLLEVRSTEVDRAINSFVRHALKLDAAAFGPFALKVAQDDKREPALRFQSLLVAMRLRAPGAVQAWKSQYEAADELAQRVRYAIIAMDSSSHLPAELFDPLLADEHAYVKRIGELGRAIASGDEAAQRVAADALLQVGGVKTSEWIVAYVQRIKPDNGATLLDRVAYAFPVGLQRKDLQLIRISSDAVLALCLDYPDQAKPLIKALLDHPVPNDRLGEVRLSVVLDGLSRVRGDRVRDIVAAIDPTKYNTPFTDALYLLQRAKNGLPLSDTQWQQVADHVQGVGTIADEHRTQLAWLYLKHKGWTDAAITRLFDQ